jgi:hypothetical protein
MVDRAASSGVVPGEPGGAPVLGASSGFAEGAHHRFGASGAASAIAHQHNHAWILPPPKQGKLFSASPYPAGRARCGRVGSVAACRVLLSVVLVDAVGLGWLGAAPRAQPTRACAWSVAGPGLAPPDQPRSAGRSRGYTGPREPAQRGRRSRPGRSPGRGELFAWVGGSSVSLTCSCTDQGGCHVDMVVGADHRGRPRVAVWRDAEPSPLTARRHQPDHGWRSCRPGRRPGGGAGASRPSGHRRPPSAARPDGIGYQPGLGPVPLGHREQFVGKAAWFGFAQQRRGRCWLGGRRRPSRSR